MSHDADGRGGSGAVASAERARRAGDPALAETLARGALGTDDDAAARAALALALLDQGEVEDARHAIETLLETLLGDGALHAGAPFESHCTAGLVSDGTVAAATAATLELVGELDDDGFERAMEEAEAQRELMFDADAVAQQALREVPAELPDELLPSADSPFATRTFADLLERQGHEAQAHTLRSSLDRRGAGAAEAHEAGRAEQAALALATLERWLENLRRPTA